MAAVEDGRSCRKKDQVHLKPIPIKALRSWIEHPLVRGVDLDSAERIARTRQIIREKAFLRKMYQHWYALLASALPRDIPGPVLELGSGGGFFAGFAESVITSEIQKVLGVDVVTDARRLAFKNQSLKAIVLIDVFHHLPQVGPFLSEAARCIKPGGVIAMIEPWKTEWAGLVYTRLHHEPVAPEAPDWQLPEGGPLSGSNSALAWIVFERDRERFGKDFPHWRIRSITPHTPFAYLLSGGVSMRGLIPGLLFTPVRRLESVLSPWMNAIAMFATIVLERRA